MQALGVDIRIHTWWRTGKCLEECSSKHDRTQ